MYTDGRTVWNREHRPMLGSDILGSPSSTQSAVIMPVPGNPKKYYIFTTESDGQRGGLRYHIVDMELDNGLGALVSKDNVLVDPVVEKLSVIRHTDRRSFWLVAHGWNSDLFYAFLVSNPGIALIPVRSRVGIAHVATSSNSNSAGAMKASLDGKHLAVAVQEAGVFEVFNFDASTGIVSARTPATQLASPAFQGCYGVEFSPDGRKLYGSILNTGAVYQFDISLTQSRDIVDKAVRIYSGGAQQPVGTLQLAPDGRIYCTRPNNNALDVIDRPNEPGELCDYQPHAVPIGAATTTLGLPLFYTAFLNMQFVYRNTCPGDSTYFFIPDGQDIEHVWWDFGEPTSGSANTSAELAPVHRYTNAGSYTVRLIITRNGVSDTTEQEVVVHTVPAPPVPSDTTLCFNSALVLSAERPSYTDYEWSTGERTPAITVSTPGVYWVRVSDKLCTIADTITVRPAPLWQMSASPDTTLCEGSSVHLFATGAASYQWTPETGLNNSTSATPTARPLTTTTYTVIATDLYGCSQQRTVTVTVVPSPRAELGADTVLCGLEQITLAPVESSPLSTYLWSTGETTPAITVSTTGTYWVLVQSGTCSLSDTISVVAGQLPVLRTLTDTTLCRGDSIVLQTSGAESYQWFADGVAFSSEASPVVRPQHTTRYTVVATSSLGCTTTASTTVYINTPIAVDVRIEPVAADIGTTNMVIPFTLSAASPVVLPSLTVQLRFDTRSLRPTGIQGALFRDQSAGIDGRIELVFSNLSLEPTPAVYALTSDILMGSTPQPVLAATVTAVTEGHCETTQTTETTLTVRGCGIGTQTVDFAGATALAVLPNPASTQAVFRFSSASDGIGNIAVYSLQGQRLWHRQHSVQAGFVYGLSIDTSAMAPGIYKVVLLSGADHAVSTLIVQH